MFSMTKTLKIANMCQFQITPEACQHVPMFKCPSSIKVLSHSPLTASQLWTRPSRATVTTKWASGENTANSNGMLPAPPHERVRKPLAMWQSDVILVDFCFLFFGDLVMMFAGVDLEDGS